MKPVYTAAFVHATVTMRVIDTFGSLYLVNQKPQDIVNVILPTATSFKWGIAECNGSEPPPTGSVLVCALALPMDDVKPLVKELIFYVYPTTADSIINYHT